MSSKITSCEPMPFLKWPGGKRWFVVNYAQLLPLKYNCYIEPFLGAGSVFFYLKPKRAILSDINADLISAYKAIRHEWSGLNRCLRMHQAKHDHAYYYAIRETNPSHPIEKAARLIYLNRTCFNGIYRVNQCGQFNVPKGSKNTVIFDTDNFELLAATLKKAKIYSCDFEISIDKAKKGDLIFADPPYTVRHNVNGFIKYNEQLFSWADQIRLAGALFRAKIRGAKIVLTNANHHSIRRLYKERGFTFLKISRYSSISADAGYRKQFDELVIRSF